MDPRAQAVLDFWYGPPDSPDFGKSRNVWFSTGGGQDFDASCRQHLLAEYERAAAGGNDDWRRVPRGCLALILLFDQLPRNIFRGDAKSFATDPHALRLARQVVDGGWDRDMMDVERLFVYLPFEHSENIEDQRRCVALYQAMPESEEKPDWVKYAVEHMEIIERFGRFPHRNDILGRPGKPEEIAFLEETGIHYGTNKDLMTR